MKTLEIHLNIPKNNNKFIYSAKQSLINDIGIDNIAKDIISTNVEIAEMTIVEAESTLIISTFVHDIRSNTSKLYNILHDKNQINNYVIENRKIIFSEKFAYMLRISLLLGALITRNKIEISKSQRLNIEYKLINYKENTK